ncbi:MAG TPA: HypC/HybG/HupF family hydrogenase formation chaperone [Vicinamibacteria bacterium]
MCLAVPGKIVEITGDGELRMGKLDFSGVRRQACLAYVPEAQLGDYVLVHVGFAISRIDEAQALETLAALREIGELEDGGDGAPAGDEGAVPPQAKG